MAGSMSSGGGASSGGGFGNYAQFAMQILPMLMGGQQQVSAAPPVDNSGLLGPPLGSEGLPRFKAASSAQIGGVDAAITPPASEQLGEKAPDNPFIGFFDKLDTNLQSPSKQIGLGLLGQQDPRLAVAGLIAMGLLGGSNDSTTNE